MAQRALKLHLDFLWSMKRCFIQHALPMLDHPLLAALAAVVREGSFERAARTLHVTPSAVSQRVRLLEERVGEVLVVRGQPCTATEAGRLLCRHAERVALLEQELREALPALAEAGSPGRPTLRVAVNADSLATWFIAAMRAFCEATPALLDLSLDDQAHTAERLRAGEVLAAVSAEAEPVPGCRSTPLGALRYVAVASPGFVARHFAAGWHAAALAGAPCLVFNSKDRLQADWARLALGGTEPPPAPTHWLPSSTAFVDAARAGIGWGLVPAALATADLAAGTLLALDGGRPLDVPLHWQCARRRLAVLDRLTDAVVAAARAQLVPIPAATGQASRSLAAPQQQT